MLNSIRYYWKIYNRFGSKAIQFLVQSKFKQDKLNNIRFASLQHPISLSNFEADVSTLFQIFLAEEYGVKLKNAPKYIIDCGANIGLSAVYFAAKYPEAKIIAIEPDKRNFNYLVKNTQAYKNVTCLNKAIWNREVNMSIKDTGTGNWGLQTVVVESADATTISGVTIEQVMQIGQFPEIDFLKIDIEGAEEDLFKENFETWLPKTKVIAIELHDTVEHQVSKPFFKAIENRRNRQYYLGENLICEFDVDR